MVLVLIALFVTQVAAVPAQGRPDERAGGRALAPPPGPAPDEVALGVLEPDREGGPRDGLAAPGCARPGPSGDERAATPGCSEAAQGGGMQGAANFKGGPGCAIQCITSGVAYAKGPGARLVVKTDTPARIILNVIGPMYSGVGDSGPGATTFTKDFLDLEANTTYQVNVTAQDSQGHISAASGKFTTLRRFATVDFGAFPIDEKASCCNDFSFYFNVDWEWRFEELNHGAPALPAALPGARAVTVLDAPQWLFVAVQVTQNTSSGGVCEGTSLPKDLPHASGWGETCWTWNTAFNTVDLDLRPPGSTSWFEHERLVSLPAFVTFPNEIAYSPLRFTAPVHLKVWYGIEP